MYRSRVILSIVFAIFSTHATAQSAGDQSPELVWQQFKEACGRVLVDPDDYLAKLQRPGNQGERVISVSPDQMVVSVYKRISNAYEEVELHIIGNRQLRDCSVIGEFYDFDTSQLAKRFVEIVSAEEEIVISGGHAPQDYLEDGTIYSEDAIYLFAVDGIWPELGVLAVAHVIAGELQLYVQHSPN